MTRPLGNWYEWCPTTITGVPAAFPRKPRSRSRRTGTYEADGHEKGHRLEEPAAPGGVACQAPRVPDRSRLEVLKQMQKAGLYSRTTKSMDVRLDSLIAEASGFEASRMRGLSEKTRLRLEGKRLAGS